MDRQTGTDKQTHFFAYRLHSSFLCIFCLFNLKPKSVDHKKFVPLNSIQSQVYEPLRPSAVPNSWVLAGKAGRIDRSRSECQPLHTSKPISSLTATCLIVVLISKSRSRLRRCAIREHQNGQHSSNKSIALAVDSQTFDNFYLNMHGLCACLKSTAANFNNE